jgi:hypothetical protein
MFDIATSDGTLIIRIKAVTLRGLEVKIGAISRLLRPVTESGATYTHRIDVAPLPPVMLRASDASWLLEMRVKATGDKRAAREIERIDGAPIDERHPSATAGGPS